MRWLAALALVFLSLTASTAQAPPRRLALVIGVSDYDGRAGIDVTPAALKAAKDAGLMPDLLNAQNDSADISQVLVERLGFKADDVSHVKNPSADELVFAIASFGEQVREAGPDAVAFVFFSGHGLQVAGENYLVPAGAKMPRIPQGATQGAVEAMLSRALVPIDLLKRSLPPRSAKGVNIVVLDACRDNPWEPSLRSTGGAGRGLAEQRWNLGNTLIAFSTEPGSTAYDGEATDRNSPYTAALLSMIARPNLSMLDMFNRTSSAVQTRTENWAQGPQRPWINFVSVPPELCLAGCAATAPLGADDAPPPALSEYYFWQKCCEGDRGGRADFEGYLTRVEAKEFPGTFVEVAKVRLANLPAGGAAGSEPTVLLRGDGGAAAGVAGPISNDPLSRLQWHLRDPGAGADQAPAGAGFVTAWRKLRALPNVRPVVVASIDTGIPADAPDLRSNLLPGIDAIADPERGGDGDGPDLDPTDEGDACGANAKNSFHGGHVAGLIAATSNNAQGVAGAGDNRIRVLPIRALGRCGGELADVVRGVQWAAGAQPIKLANGREAANRAPADVIALNLSIQVPCPASLQAAIDAANKKGAVVVVAAGNKSRATKAFAPANCKGVLVVGALDRAGAMTFYSNFGPEISLLVPGGDLFNDSDADGQPDGLLSTRKPEECSDSDRLSDDCAYTFLMGTSPANSLAASGVALLKAATGLEGEALRTAFLARAVRPLPRAACEIACDKSPEATRIPGEETVCLRPCGAGALDMSRAFQ